MPSELFVLHVTPGHRGAWIVVVEDTDERLSEHSDASAAVRAASTYADERGGCEILVHDHYHHVHPHPRMGRR